MGFKNVKDMNELRLIIIARRLQKNMTQHDLSKKSGIPQATISHIENYHVKLNLGTLFKCLEALDMDFQLQGRD